MKKYNYSLKIFNLILMSLTCVFLVSCGKKPGVNYLNNNPTNINPVNINTQNITPNAVSQQQPSFEATDKFEKKVVISIENNGRMDPFLPYSEKNIVISKNSKIFDITLPPAPGENDFALKDLIQAKVSGILYDRYRPAAIVNVLGEDHLVKKGDRISDFYIKDIQKNYVMIKSGFNIYKAAIGEIVDGSTDSGTKTSNASQSSSSMGGIEDKIEIKPVKDLPAIPTSINKLPELPAAPASMPPPINSLKKVYNYQYQGVINS